MIDMLFRCATIAVIYVVVSIHQAPSAEANPCRVQSFGDSITAGIGSISEPGGYRAHLARVPGIQMVGQQTLWSPPWMVIAGQAWNSGAPGARIDQLWEHTNPLHPLYPVLPFLPNIILVHAGTNDIQQGHGPHLAVDRLIVLLDSMLYWHYHVWGNWPTILVAKIIPMKGLYDWRNVEVDYFNSQVDGIVNARRALGYRIHVVDHNTGFSKVDHMHPVGDDLHPNDAGYDLMAQRWLGAIALHGCY